MPFSTGPSLGGEGAPTAGAALVDLDQDGDLDLVDAGARLRILDNDGGLLRDASAARGLPALTLPAPLVAVVAGDYDNDERTDLFVLGEKQHALLHQRADGTFEDTTKAAGIPAPAGSPATVAFVDADHDGDLDLVVGGAAPVLLRNNGNGTFADVTAASGIAKAALRPIAIVPTDVDNRRDVDLLIARDTGAPALFKNLRDGTFADIAGDVGLAALGVAPARITAVAAADVNKDGFTDFFFGRIGAASVLAASDGRGRFTASPIDGLEGVTRGAVRRSRQRRPARRRRRARPAGLVQVRNGGSSGPAGARVPAWTVMPLNALGGAVQTAGSARTLTRPCKAPGGSRPATSTATATPTWWLRATSGPERGRLLRAEERRRQQAGVAPRPPVGQGQQPQRGRLEDRAARRQPAAEARDRERVAGGRAERHRVRPRRPRVGGRRARAVARRHRAGRAAARSRCACRRRRAARRRWR